MKFGFFIALSVIFWAGAWLALSAVVSFAELEFAAITATGGGRLIFGAVCLWLSLHVANAVAEH